MFHHQMPRPAISRKPPKALALIEADREHAVRLAFLLILVTWFPTFLLSVVSGGAALRSFMFDFAAQSRLLVVIPLLIVTEPSMIQRWKSISQHFKDASLLRKEDEGKWQSALIVFEKRRHSIFSQSLILVAVFGFALLVVRFSGHVTLPIWCQGQAVMGKLSWPGAWYAFIALPLLIYLVLRWLFLQTLWAVFLNKMSRLNLRLLPVHPDLMAGLSFLETSLRACLPFAFAIGTIVAGGISNQLARGNSGVAGFKSTSIATVAIVLLICTGPLYTFFGILLRTRHRGTFEYGALAIELGHRFESKWLERYGQVEIETLQAPDFSATTDLYSITANVRSLKSLPFGTRSILRLLIFTVSPAIPVALAFVPFEVIAEKAAKLIF